MKTSLFDSSVEAGNNFHYENHLSSQGFRAIAGSDEAGRGPLAGPVVASSVILPADCNPQIFLDSKKLTHKKLKELFSVLHELDAVIGIGIVSEQEIDTMNILQASLYAMQLSVADITAQGHAPDFILVDGKFEIPLPTPQRALIKGETKSASIAAASIIAKVTRDALMEDLHKQYPIYNFGQHKGYPTKAHRKIIAEHGPCPAHRKSFKGVKEFVK